MNSKAKTPGLDPAPETIGKRIEHARRYIYDLSQEQLGEMVEVTRAAISQYEKDKITPKARVIDKLAEVFNASPEWFTHGRGIAPKLDNVPVTIPEIDLALLNESVSNLRNLGMGRIVSLPMAWFRRPVHRDHLVAFRAPNSALPKVREDEFVIVDLKQTAVERGAAYLVAYKKGAYLRVYVEEPDAGVVLGRVVACFRAD
jgi:transcriptional regulator with XRE-family HTH domain